MMKKFPPEQHGYKRTTYISEKVEQYMESASDMEHSAIKGICWKLGSFDDARHKLYLDKSGFYLYYHRVALGLGTFAVVYRLGKNTCEILAIGTQSVVVSNEV